MFNFFERKKKRLIVRISFISIKNAKKISLTKNIVKIYGTKEKEINKLISVEF